MVRAVQSVPRALYILMKQSTIITQGGDVSSPGNTGSLAVQGEGLVVQQSSSTRQQSPGQYSPNGQCSSIGHAEQGAGSQGDWGMPMGSSIGRSVDGDFDGIMVGGRRDLTQGEQDGGLTTASVEEGVLDWAGEQGLP